MPIKTNSPLARSDELPALLEILSPLRNSIPINFIKFRIIVDANVILSDIRWMLSPKTAPGVKTSLLELLEANAIECLAPTFIDEEVNKNIRLFNKRYGIDISEAQALWDQFKSKMLLHDVGGPDEAENGVRDPKDMPYIRLQNAEKAVIVTKDKDITGMNGKAVPPDVLIDLRGYARNKAITLKVLVVGGGSIYLPLTMITNLIRKVTAVVIPRAKNVPIWIWLLPLGFLALLLCHPDTRAKIISFVDTLTQGTIDFGKICSEALQYLTDAYSDSSAKADEFIEHITEQFDRAFVN